MGNTSSWGPIWVAPGHDVYVKINYYAKGISKFLHLETKWNGFMFTIWPIWVSLDSKVFKKEKEIKHMDQDFEQHWNTFGLG